ncbi:MAG: CYTH domain-containing protein [Gammaproteobacteria bacterium]|nr:CYTH domain-containing protein [Gammaproteobacteria bacterium]
MALEIERKYLVINDDWRKGADQGTLFRQGYLLGSEAASVRVRIEGDKANLNIKSATLGIRRSEYEYAIPLADAEELLNNLCQQPLIEKVRYLVHHAGHEWEVDVFSGDNLGLIVAEIELMHENEAIDLPHWVGQEVSNDPRYYNVCLVKAPYKLWQETV